MVKTRKVGWTTISVPIWNKKHLQEYGKMEETWCDLFERMMKELEECRIMKERYKFK